MNDQRTTILVSGVPRAIKAKALGAGTSLNDEVVGVLSAHYGVRFDPIGRTSTGGNVDSDRMFLRMSTKLADKIFKDAVSKRSDKSAIICGILAANYGVTYRSRSKRTVPFGGGRRRAPVAA